MFLLNSKNKIILTFIILLMFILVFKSNAYAKLVKDAKGKETAKLKFYKKDNFEIKNLISSLEGEEYKITVKKNGYSNTANFSASSGDTVNVDIHLDGAITSNFNNITDIYILNQVLITII